jgi:hypothetical protein
VSAGKVQVQVLRPAARIVLGLLYPRRLQKIIVLLLYWH